MIDNLIWAAATLGNLAIFYALARRRGYATILWIELASAVLWVSQDVMALTSRYDVLWWVPFDVLGIIIQTMLFATLARRELRGMAQTLPLNYLMIVFAKFAQYGYADDQQIALANKIYYVRVVFGIFNSFLMAYCLYRNDIGGSTCPQRDKSPYLPMTTELIPSSETTETHHSLSPTM